MAPADLLRRLRTYVGHTDHQILFTLLYVVPFYLSKSTRPSPTLNRDAPSVIRARIQTVTLACIFCTAITLYILLTTSPPTTLLTALHLLGFYPIRPLPTLQALLLTLLLYTGPLFEKIVIEHDLHDFQRGQLILETLSSWVGYRNYIAGPITEELIFRSLIIPLHLLSRITTPAQTIFLTPLYFGIAHIHHLYEFTLTHPHTPFLPALALSLFQFAFTTVFGWYASFIFLRTGSLYACVIIHAFCNWVGLPRFWGRVRRRERYGGAPPAVAVLVRGKEDAGRDRVRDRGELPVVWTVAYYVLLFAGAAAFKMGFWSLTESEGGLVEF